MEQQRALSEQIKAARAAQPKESPLERVISRQEKQPKWLVEVLVGRVKARIAAGQPQEEATAAVLSQYARLIQQALANQDATAE